MCNLLQGVDKRMLVECEVSSHLKTKKELEACVNCPFNVVISIGNFICDDFFHTQTRHMSHNSYKNELLLNNFMFLVFKES